MLRQIYAGAQPRSGGRIGADLALGDGYGGGQRSVLALDGDKWKPRPVYRTRQGGNGFGINDGGAMYTLNTVDRHIVAILGGTDE